MSNPMNDLRREAEGHGLKLVRQTNHGFLYRDPQTGLRWSSSRTAGDQNAARNARKDLERLLQARAKPWAPDSDDAIAERLQIEAKAKALLAEPEVYTCNICRKILPLTMFGPSRQGDLGHRRNCQPCQERREVLMATRQERMAMVEARRQQVQEATAGKTNGLMDSTEDRVIETPGLASQVVEIPSLVAVPPYGGGFLPRLPQYDIGTGTPKETKPEQDPEAMATKVLIKRHREEYDSLVETFMEGLWS